MPMAKVLPRGQVTLPKAIRRAIDLKPGDVVSVKVTGPDTLEMKVLTRLTLAEALERYRIDVPINLAADRELWETEAAKDALRELSD